MIPERNKEGTSILEKAKTKARGLLLRIGQKIIDDGRPPEHIARAAEVNRNLVLALARGEECNPTTQKLMQIAITINFEIYREEEPEEFSV